MSLAHIASVSPPPAQPNHRPRISRAPVGLPHPSTPPAQPMPRVVDVRTEPHDSNSSAESSPPGPSTGASVTTRPIGCGGTP